jgi:dihydrofolate synthase/folylpolyglutamate synthase
LILNVPDLWVSVNVTNVTFSCGKGQTLPCINPFRRVQSKIARLTPDFLMVTMKETAIAYQEALDYLYGFVDYSLTRSFRNSPEKFDLERMRAFLKLLGDPQQKYSCIHIAGTKGKGSTAAFIASSLRQAGLRVGLYSSPHLQEFTERIQVNGLQISQEDLARLVEQVKPAVNAVQHLTTFEITTAVGFLYFAQQSVDIAVVEVGLGGRLDATNVLSPLVSVITSLSMDHMNVLGDTLPKIAFEKAGIIKPGRPVVIAPQQAEARLVIEQAAAERGSALSEVGRDFFYTAGLHDLEGQTLRLRKAAENSDREFRIPLLGMHQVENAATAYAALRIARDEGVAVSDAAIQAGFASVRWPGRFEILSREPLLIVDSAHNRDSARRLRQTLDDYFPGRPVVLLFGASEDKDVEGMFAELMPRMERVVATQSVHPRAMEAERLVALAERFDCPAEAVVPVEKALPAAIRLAGQDGKNALVLAAGSLFIAAAVTEVWQAWARQAENPANMMIK